MYHFAFSSYRCRRSRIVIKDCCIASAGGHWLLLRIWSSTFGRITLPRSVEQSTKRHINLAAKSLINWDSPQPPSGVTENTVVMFDYVIHDLLQSLNAVVQWLLDGGDMWCVCVNTDHEISAEWRSIQSDWGTCQVKTQPAEHCRCYVSNWHQRQRQKCCLLEYELNFIQSVYDVLWAWCRNVLLRKIFDCLHH